MIRPVCLGLFAIAACDVAPPPASTGGIELGADPPPGCPRGFAVLQSDYQSTNVSLLDLDGRELSASFISSASAAAGLSAPLSGDVVAPTGSPPGDELVLLDRYPASVISWIDLRRAEVRAQLPVATGFAANPHDYVQVSSQKAFVSRFDPNPAPGREPFDAGSDLLVVDPSIPAVVGAVDLGPALPGAPSGFHPRPDKLALVDGRVIALLSGYSADFVESLSSRLVALDPVDDSITDVLVMEGLHGCAGLAISPDGLEVAVACSGEFGGGSVPSLEGSGVVRVATKPRLAEVQRYPASAFGDTAVAFAIAYAGRGQLLFTTLGRFAVDGALGADDRLHRLDLSTGASDVVLRSADEPFSLGEVRCAGASGRCFLADAARGVVHRFDVGADGLTGQLVIEVGAAIGLPPRYLGTY